MTLPRRAGGANPHVGPGGFGSCGSPAIHTKITGMAALADKADTTALATFTGLIVMSGMSLFLHSVKCRLIARDMGRLKKGM